MNVLPQLFSRTAGEHPEVAVDAHARRLDARFRRYPALPVRPRRRPAALLLLPLLTTVTACEPEFGFCALSLKARIAVGCGIGAGCILAGVGLGVLVAVHLLRAADRAAAHYHRAQIARVLGASSSVHAAVQDVLTVVHRRTQELKRLVATLERGGAR